MTTGSAQSMEDETPVGRPYGLFGLSVSVIVILITTILVCLLTFAVVFGTAALVMGGRPALDRFADLRAAAGSEQAFLQRLGVVTSLLVYAALSATVIAAASWRAGAGWRDLIAWRPWQPLQGARLFWVLVVATLVYSFAADALVSHFYPPSTDWVTLPKGAPWTAFFIILAVLFAPLAEELLFRGWIYTALRQTIGVWAGILVTSGIFALAHWEKTHLYALAVFPVGIALGFVRETTGSIKASMTFHAIYNATASALLVFGT